MELPEYWWGDESQGFDLEVYVNQQRAKWATMNATTNDEPKKTEELLVSKQEIQDMKSDLRSLHIMMEMVVEKLERIEESLKTKKDGAVRKKRAITQKVTPDLKRIKMAKITEVFQRFPEATMTQQGHVTVLGSKYSGVNT